MQFKAIFIETFTHFWEARQQRERQFLITATVVFVVTLVYLIAIDPAITGRQELKKSLPILHQQAAAMQQMVQELAAIPSAENRHEVSRELIETALSHNGLKAQTLSVNDGVIRAQFSSTSMSALQTWLLEMQKSSGLFVEEIKITGLEGGLVSVNLTLRQSVTNGSN
ncbi:Type II secretion system (T2SS), protein M [Solimicrobium silvestre]|uniref:Type II secretion system (T2SS), protein M n=2 Tax=Solimicrobium silvestre TaxID=2099400 RepID=A0A2S9GYR6_9BURK|nr:Type II secretion system (T2SS), protein M [Solimicrobium silvestre]